MALTLAGPAMAQETESAELTMIQQLKEQVNIEVNNTETGVTINFTIDEGPIEPTLHLLDIYANHLENRDYSARDRVNISFSSITNGFAMHIDGTQPKFVEKIQKRVSNVDFPARLKHRMVRFLGNHGIN